MRIEFSHGAIAALEQQAGAAMQGALMSAHAEAAGRPVSEVLTVLRRRLHEAGLEPDEVGIRPIAEAISAGTFAH